MVGTATDVDVDTHVIFFLLPGVSRRSRVWWPALVIVDFGELVSWGSLGMYASEIRPCNFNVYSCWQASQTFKDLDQNIQLADRI